MHSGLHSKSGQYFFVNLNGGNVQAIEDRCQHGSRFQLIDWADRLPLDTDFSPRRKAVACMFYAHRCQPDLSYWDYTDPVAFSALKLDGVVYGVCTIEYDDHSTDQLILIRESVLRGQEES